MQPTEPQRLGLAAHLSNSPVDDIYLDFVLAKNKESPEWDFKETLSIARESGFPKVAKDIFAFANYGGGYIMIGVAEKEKGGYERRGLPEDYHLEAASIQEKFNAYSPEKLALDYVEFVRTMAGAPRKFACLYVPPSKAILAPLKDGMFVDAEGKQQSPLKKGLVYIRRGTQSIPAEESEIEFIRSRIHQDGYQIALVSGQPDQIKETLYSNLFQVKQIPAAVFSARIRDGNIPFLVERRCAHVISGEYLYAFDNPVENELAGFILKGSLKRFPTSEWTQDQDGTTLLRTLLNRAILAAGNRRNLFVQLKHNRLFFPTDPQQGERFVHWRGLSRSGPRKVAGTVWVEQLGTTIYVHEAVAPRFTSFGEKTYLTLEPSFVLTWDGRRIIKDPKVGSIITRLMYRKFNAAYLRDIKFWVEQLETAPGSITLAAGGLVIETRPVTTTVDLGIRADQIRSQEDLEMTTDDEPPKEDPR